MRLRRTFALCLSMTLVFAWSTVAEAASPLGATRGVVMRVVDEAGAPLASSGVIACPYEGGDVCNTSHVITSTANKAGAATIRLAPGERYDLRGFVMNPSPPWACPGM